MRAFLFYLQIAGLTIGGVLGGCLFILAVQVLFSAF